MKEVLIDKEPCRTVANKYDIPHVTSRRYCMNYCEQHAENDNTVNVPSARMDILIIALCLMTDQKLV